ncbi:MAG: thiol reductase thioredoxin, partial [Verrucomicrobia bacterium]|nr:thiol reductase thioredoxin [Verrucomicrobiota bacterium]
MQVENMNLNNTKSNLRFLAEANFESEVLQSKRTVLVAFWAPWSKPCQVIEPVLLEVAQACADNIEVLKVNADDNPNLSLWLGVQHIPTLFYFEAGSLCGRLVGTASKEAIL